MKPEIINFKLPSEKIISLRKYDKKKFVASCHPFGFGPVNIDNLFFEFSYLEQVSIIYHELWHKENNLKFEIKYRTKRPWLWILFFINKPILHAQEFEADLNSLNMTNKKDTLSMLVKLKEIIDSGIIPKRHERTHPKIEERIKRINEIQK